jgi:hypothetical protein
MQACLFGMGNGRQGTRAVTYMLVVSSGFEGLWVYLDLFGFLLVGNFYFYFCLFCLFLCILLVYVRGPYAFSIKFITYQKK